MAVISENEAQFYGPVSVCGYPDRTLSVLGQTERAPVREVKPVFHPGVEAKFRMYEQAKHDSQRLLIPTTETTT